jgi:hypothetical protein
LPDAFKTPASNVGCENGTGALVLYVRCQSVLRCRDKAQEAAVDEMLGNWRVLRSYSRYLWGWQVDSFAILDNRFVELADPVLSVFHSGNRQR